MNARSQRAVGITLPSGKTVDLDYDIGHLLMIGTSARLDPSGMGIL